jgi:predicted metal-binding membrane protein
MSAHTEAPRRVRDPAMALWTVAGVCWAATVLLIVLGGDELASHDQIVEHSTLPWVVRIALFLLIWTVMVGAMMLPTTVPMARLVAAVGARAPERGAARSALALSYLAVWVGFGLVALTGDLGVHAAVDSWPWLDGHSELVLAGVLGFAGAFQFSRLKDRYLTACRDPLSLLWRHYGRGGGAGWRLGVHHAMNCLGCCWALMLLMFGVGVGSPTWMLLLTAVMVAEKTTRWGQRLTAPVGVGLLVTAAVLALAALGVAPFAPTFSGGYG